MRPAPLALSVVLWRALEESRLNIFKEIGNFSRTSLTSLREAKASGAEGCPCSG